ncbi:hypothetical protein KQI63_15385 [bacterium]|nr:hypothetical protein [bacterium]
MRFKRAVNQTWAALLLVLITSSVVLAETWTTITSGWRPSEIVAVGNEIYAASEGGILRVNQETGQLHVLNVDDGFSANFATTVAVDPQTGYLWIGYEGAALDVYNPTTRRFVQRITDFYNDPETITVYDVHFYNNQAFVATNQGLSRLTYSEDYDTWVVIDTYRAFGPWPRSTGMRRSTVFDGKIFAGGDDGVAVATLDDNLINAANWQAHRFVEDMGISSDANTYTRMLKVVDGQLYLIAYSQGYYVWQDDHFVPLGNEGYVFGLAELDGDLYGATGAGLKRYDEGSGQFSLVETDFRPKLFDLATVGNSLWLAMDTNTAYFGGIARWTDGVFEPYYPNTPGGDQVSHIETAPDGSVWMAAKNTLTSGYYCLHDGIWYPYAKANYPEGSFNRVIGVTALGFDSHGDTWVGTWGDGCYYITQTAAGTDTLLMFDATSSSLRSVGDSESNYVVISGFAVDPDGGLWLSNQEAWDDHSVVYIPPDWFNTPLEFRNSDSWVFYGPQQGVMIANAGPLAVDSRGRVWIESLKQDSTDPLTVLDPEGTPEDLTNQDVTVLRVPSTMEDYGAVADMVIDADGILWLATPLGLFWLDTELEDVSDATYNRVFGILGESVNCLALDPIGQVWVGTDFGVSVVGRDRYTIVREYTSEDGRSPSPLVTDKITALGVDPATGFAYIGTGVGTSVVATPFRDFADELGEIEVVPQPFLIGKGMGANLQFSTNSLIAGAEVRIYTPSGRLVRELSFDTAATAGWDGRTEDGDYVASGVYLLLVTDPGGNSKSGKVAVVRR